jgi:hypothetical protein
VSVKVSLFVWRLFNNNLPSKVNLFGRDNLNVRFSGLCLVVNLFGRDNLNVDSQDCV